MVLVPAWLVVAALGLLRWSTGAAHRTGFALARALDRPGLVDTPARRALYVGVVLLPVVAAAATLAVALGARRLAGALVVVLGAVAVVAAAVALVNDATGPGAVVTLAAGSLAAGAGGRLVITRAGDGMRSST